MGVASGIIVGWPGAHGGWPSGWSRETTLDTRYVKCIPDTSTQGGTNAGATTHTHAQSSSHTHGGPGGHSHSGTSGSASGSSVNTGVLVSSGPMGTGHSHGFSVSSDSVGSLGSGGTAGFTGASTPAYFEVAFIKSDGSPLGFPNTTIAMWNNSTLPTNWRLCDGSSGAPNISNAYLKGAAASGAGGGTGGSNTHTHTESDHSDHSIGSHNHSASGGGGPSGSVRNPGSGTSASNTSHSHTFSGSLNSSGASASGASALGTTSSDSGESPYQKTLFIQNNTGGVDTPQNIIAMYLGTIASIPAGWALCDGQGGRPNFSTGQFLKGGANTTDFGSTGGTTNHDHGGTGGASHTHGCGSHSHGSTSISSSGASSSSASDTTGAADLSLGHTHGGGSVSSDSAGSSSATTSGGAVSVAVAPLSTTIAFITNLVGGGGILIVSD